MQRQTATEDEAEEEASSEMHGHPDNHSIPFH